MVPQGSVAVIDACSLHRTFSRAAILYLVYVKYLSPVVSQMIVDEFVDSLSKVKEGRPPPKMTKDEAQDLANHILAKFGVRPVVFGEEDDKRIEDLKPKFKSERAKNDAHVLHLADITELCFFIITDNTNDFPPHQGVAAVSPDDMLTSMLGANYDIFRFALETIAYGTLRAKSSSLNEQIRYMKNHGHFDLLREKLATNTDMRDAIQDQLDLWKGRESELIRNVG